MSDEIAKIAEKITPRHLETIMYTATIVSGAILFAPDGLLKPLRLVEFANNYSCVNYSCVPGLIFMSFISASILQWIKGSLTKKMERKRQKENLQRLTREEKEILKPYIDDKVETLACPLGSSVVNGLASKGIISMATANHFRYEVAAYHITDFAREYLTKHPELLER